MTKNEKLSEILGDILKYNKKTREFNPLRKLDRSEKHLFGVESKIMKNDLLLAANYLDEDIGYLFGELYTSEMLSADDLVFFIHSMNNGGLNLLNTQEKKSLLNTLFKEKNNQLCSDLFESIFNFIEKKSILFFVEELRGKKWCFEEKKNAEKSIFVEKKALGGLDGIISTYIENLFYNETVEKRICAYLKNNENYLLIDKIITRSFMFSKDETLFKKYFNALNDKYKYLISNYVPINFMFVYDQNYDKNIIDLTKRPDFFRDDENKIIDHFINRIEYIGSVIGTSMYKKKEKDIEKELNSFKAKFNKEYMNFSNNEITTNLFNKNSNILAEKIFNFIMYFIEENKEKTVSEIKSFYWNRNNEIKLKNGARRKRIQLNLFDFNTKFDFFNNLDFYQEKKIIDPLKIEKINSNAFDSKTLIRLVDVGITRDEAASFVNEAMVHKVEEYNNGSSLYLNLSDEELDWIELNLVI